MPTSWRSKFIVFETSGSKSGGRSGKFRWKLVVRGESVAQSAKAFTSRANARRSIDSLGRHLGAPVVDE